ncbi:hypothetical protein K7432_017823 [Basidiobolus ranarum]|uniref:Uncharacterized protein n=1 Tax=Basidiobolus ranarum TaxID=34480 RepID=A0ABR2VJT8_9FUNG
MNFLHKFRGYFRLDDLKRTRYPRRVLYKLLSVPLLITLILTIYLFNRSKVDVEFERATRQCHAPYYDVLKEDGEEKVISRQNKILSERLQNCSFLEGRTPLIYSPERQDWTFPMDKESDMLLELIRCNVPFAFTRWGDGEHMLLQGKTIVDGSQAKALDNWQWTENRVGVLAQDLIESLGNTVGLYFHGFPCPLPWTKSLKNFMAWAKKTPTSRMSYSTVWIGGFGGESIREKRFGHPLHLDFARRLFSR